MSSLVIVGLSIVWPITLKAIPLYRFNLATYMPYPSAHYIAPPIPKALLTQTKHLNIQKNSFIAQPHSTISPYQGHFNPYNIASIYQENIVHIFKKVLNDVSLKPLYKTKMLYGQVWQYIVLLILLFIIYIIYKIIALLSRFILKKWNFISDKKKASMRWLVFILIVSFLLKKSFIVLGLEKFESFLNRLLTIIISLALTCFIYECIGIIQEQIKTNHPNNKHITHMLPLYSMTAKVIIILAGIVATIDSFGFNTESLVKALSMSTLGIGLAIQDPVKNLFASFMITMDQPFSIGDDIASGSIRGKVEEIGLRATLIRTKEGSLVYIPNAKLAESSIDNFGKRNERVVFLEVPLSYDMPLQELSKFVKALRSIVKHQPYIKQNKTVIYFDHMHEKGFKIIMKLHLDTHKKEIEYECKNKVIFLTLQVAHKLNIQLGIIDHIIPMHNIPYGQEPTYTESELEKFLETPHAKR